MLPCEDNLLRNITLDRTSMRVGRYDNLPRDIESALTQVFELELDNLRRVEMIKRDLELRYDYSTYACFRTLDFDNDGVITTFNLMDWLKRNGHYATEREVLAIIRRIDTDGDAKLSYEEFADFLRLSSARDSLKTRSYS